MKSKIYTGKWFLLLGLIMLVSAAAEAQRGRGYYRRHNSYSYYRYSRPYYYNRSVVSLGFGYRPYGYYPYYRPYGYYSLGRPLIGLHLNILPRGYRTIYVGPNPYYYYNGTYYRSYRNRYETVAPPLGAQVPELPRGAQVKVIDGEKYFETNGTFYKEVITDKNEIWYEVVGVNGVLNTGQDNGAGAEKYDDQVGDTVDTLPEGSKAVVINKQKYYKSPAGLYYQEVIEGDHVYYEVVGKSDDMPQ